MFLGSHGWIGLATLGAVFLAVTGCEALYADLGHFGRGPIQTAWLFVALPALTLNYFGQGALLLASPEAIENPFYLLYPDWALLPMVGLAAAATVIASQAVITGAFSLANQAVQLGLLPRLHIQRTSETQAGQIFIPRINGILLVGVLLLVGQFQSSSALASAYGIAVSGTMVVTALMALVVVWKSWKWPLWAAAALIVPVLLIDTTFLTANMLKVFHGGWVPLLIGGFVIVIMLTSRKGAKILAAKTRRLETPIVPLVQSLEKRPPPRVPGTAAFLTSTPDSAPTALLHSLKHYKVILTIITENVPRVAAKNRVEIEPLGDSFMRVVLHFCFMESPNVPKALAIARKHGWTFDIMSTSFFLSRRSVRPMQGPACRCGRTGCSSSWRRTPTMRRVISSCPRTAWSRSARRSPCSEPLACGCDGFVGIWEPVPIRHEASRPGHLPLGVAAALGLGLGHRLFAGQRL
jgi:KUP system potassium uptake protein